MGLSASKLNEHDENDELTEGSVPSTPISTPKIRSIDLDPRSPSDNIIRTPIQAGPRMDHTPIIGVINKSDETVNIDPRSPSVQFTRTPIVLKEDFKYYNKNLDKVRQQNGPILISISPITKKSQLVQRKSYIGLLETDLDCLETDLDAGLDTSPSLIQNDQIIKHLEEDIVEVKPELIKPIEDLTNTEQSDFKITHKEQNLELPVVQLIIDELLESVVNTLQKKRQELIKNEAILSPIKNEAILSPIKNEAILSPIKKTLEKISEIDQEIKEMIAHNPTTFDEDLSKEFDKKVTSLIYEDTVSTITKKQQPTRIALTDKNLNQQQRISKLKVSDKPTISKIPVFKEKRGKSTKNSGLQCENTPPRQKVQQRQRSRQSQWDAADNTFII